MFVRILLSLLFSVTPQTKKVSNFVSVLLDFFLQKLNYIRLIHTPKNLLARNPNELQEVCRHGFYGSDFKLRFIWMNSYNLA